jgi:hypothetical protein
MPVTMTVLMLVLAISFNLTPAGLVGQYRHGAPCAPFF